MALVASCSCCTLRLLKIAGCVLSALMQEIQPCALDEGNHRSPRSPPFSTVVNTRDCLKFRELKYEVVNGTKVVGEHSHPNLCPPGQSRVYLTGCGGCALSIVPRVWRRYLPPRTLLEGLGDRRWWSTAIPLEDAAIKRKPGCAGGTANSQGQLQTEMGMVPPARPHCWHIRVTTPPCIASCGDPQTVMVDCQAG